MQQVITCNLHAKSFYSLYEFSERIVSGIVCEMKSFSLAL